MFDPNSAKRVRLLIEGEEVHFTVVDFLHEAYRYFLDIANDFGDFVKAVNDLINHSVV